MGRPKGSGHGLPRGVPFPLLERVASFWKLVSKGAPHECWLWTGFMNKKGYGRFPFNSKLVYVHRFSWFIHRGTMPSVCVLHRCDVPCCVNPDHLFLGTIADNNHDMLKKGRYAKNRPRACKIDADTVRLIRRMRIPRKFGVKRIAKQLNLHYKTVECAIYKRKGVV